MHSRTRQERAVDFVELLTEQITPDSWSDQDRVGAGADVRIVGDRLLIFDSVRGHEQIERLLNGIRQSLADSKPPLKGGSGVR